MGNRVSKADSERTTLDIPAKMTSTEMIIDAKRAATLKSLVMVPNKANSALKA